MTVVPMKFRDCDDPRRHDLWTTPARLPELNDLGLLTAVLRCPGREKVARALLARFRGLSGVFGADEFALRSVEGMGRDDIIDVMLVQEAAVRVARGVVGKRPVTSSWTALLAYVRVAMASETREQFRVLFLDKKNAIILDEVMNRGTVDHAPVYPREIVRRALELDASAVILVHNHPSGDPAPRRVDARGVGGGWVVAVVGGGGGGWGVGGWGGGVVLGWGCVLWGGGADAQTR